MIVRSREQLHQALRLNPAFCKLEVLNLNNMSKFAQRAMFSGEHHQLGIILAPDEEALYSVSEDKINLLTYFRHRLSGLKSNKPGSSM